MKALGAIYDVPSTVICSPDGLVVIVHDTDAAETVTLRSLDNADTTEVWVAHLAWALTE